MVMVPLLCGQRGGDRLDPSAIVHEACICADLAQLASTPAFIRNDGVAIGDATILVNLDALIRMARSICQLRLSIYLLKVMYGFILSSSQSAI
jgi:hypothetical protein